MMEVSVAYQCLETITSFVEKVDGANYWYNLFFFIFPPKVGVVQCAVNSVQNKIKTQVLKNDVMKIY